MVNIVSWFKKKTFDPEMDIVEFANEHIELFTKHSGGRLSPRQEEIIRSIHNNNGLHIIDGDRQTGKTLLASICLVFEVLRQASDKSRTTKYVEIQGGNRHVSINVFKKIRGIIEILSKAYRGIYTLDTSRETQKETLFFVNNICVSHNSFPDRVEGEFILFYGDELHNDFCKSKNAGSLSSEVGLPNKTILTGGFNNHDLLKSYEQHTSTTTPNIPYFHHTMFWFDSSDPNLASTMFFRKTTYSPETFKHDFGYFQFYGYDLFNISKEPLSKEPLFKDTTVSSNIQL